MPAMGTASNISNVGNSLEQLDAAEPRRAPTTSPALPSAWLQSEATSLFAAWLPLFLTSAAILLLSSAHPQTTGLAALTYFRARLNLQLIYTTPTKQNHRI